MSLYRITPVLNAVMDVISDAGYVVTDDVVTDTGEYVIVNNVTTPDPDVLVLRGPTVSEILVQVTAVGDSREWCLLVGEDVRESLCAQENRVGSSTLPETPGIVFGMPTSMGDGQYRLVHGVHQWVETFRVSWQTVIPPAS